MMPGKLKKRQKQLNTYIKYSSLSFQMAFIIALGVFIGDYIDKISNTSNRIYTITTSLLAFGFSMYYVFKKIKHNNDKE